MANNNNFSSSSTSSWEHLPKEVCDVLRTFVIPHERLIKISEDIQAEFARGLSEPTSESIAMLPSFVPALPDGSGKIIFLVLNNLDKKIWRVFWVKN